MRTILVLDPACGPTCCWFLAFPATCSLPLAAMFFLTRSSFEPAEPEQLSRLRGFASSGLRYTVSCATLSKGLTVERCKTLF